MEINKENYEAFLLDLWEGNLSEEEKVVLSRFLIENPELDDTDNFNLLNDLSITQTNDFFDKSAIQFEQINLKNYDYFFIAYLEGDLTKEELNMVDEFLNQNPSLNVKFSQFKKAYLPLESISYSRKEKLMFGKTKVISIQTIKWTISLIAASIVLFLYFNIPFNGPTIKYSMKEYQKLEIEKFESKSTAYDNFRSSKTILIAEEEPDSEIKTQELMNKKDEKSIVNHASSPTPLLVYDKDQKLAEFHKNNVEQNHEIISNLEPKKISETIASIGLTKTNKEEQNSIQKEEVQESIPTISDLATNYLQRKNVLNDKRKPDVKGIINSFSTINNEKPIIIIEEEDNVKTTIFQLRGLKVERKKGK